MPSHQKTVLCRYHYDPLDRLIGLKPPVQAEIQRFYCKNRLATEIQDLAQCSVLQQGDLLLAQQQRQGDTKETTLLATDQQRTVLHTIGEHPRPPIAYSPYGHHHAESGLTSLLGFNGERPESITGHYLLGNGYRAFNPVLMRFNSPDSLSPFGKGGLNAYAYCLGDPVNRSDPTGNVSFALALKNLIAYLTPRQEVMKSIPWHSWTTTEVNFSKVITGKSNPFAISDFQPDTLFRSNPSSGSFSPPAVLPPPTHQRIIHRLEPLQRQIVDGLDVKVQLEAPAHVRRVIDANYFNNSLMKAYSRATARRSESEIWDFIATPGAAHLDLHLEKFRLVLHELKGKVGYKAMLPDVKKVRDVGGNR